MLGRHRDADDGQGRVGGERAREVRGPARDADKHPDAAVSFRVWMRNADWRS